MSADDLTFKTSSVCKHKERKPKKPHYIPRPWGKPYNYKCFQCPFTCMEKSHLYNHMKYSLCKNSLSLLIESDWPYKKGNVLQPEQLRSLQQGHRLRAAAKGGLENFQGADEPPRGRSSAVTFGGSIEEEVEERRDMEEIQGPDGDATDKEVSDQTGGSAGVGTQKPKRSEADFVITDVFSLEEQLLKSRSADAEARLKHYKLSKSCVAASGLLSEPWRFLASGHRKAKAESALLSNGTTPCYPPPPAFPDCSDAPGLNLSVFGVSYPLSPGLFSYVNPAVSGAASGHAQVNQLPFLASAAQLIHPASSSLPHADRPLLPPRFYYPLLCDHTFGTAQLDPGKGGKLKQSPSNGLDSSSSAGFSPKINLWKVPALRPSFGVAPPSPWTSHQNVAVSPEGSYTVSEEKGQARIKDTKSWSLKSTIDGPMAREVANKRTGAPAEVHEGPSEKRTAVGSALDLLKNTHVAPSISIATDKVFHHSSFLSARHHSKSLEEWHLNLIKAASENVCDELSMPLKPDRAAGTGCPEQEESQQEDRSSEAASVLLTDLSRALQEYQEAEHRVSHLVKGDHPTQRPLWEHLCKIRSELSHIHQALEKTARQNEGPLDLSMKKDTGSGDGESEATKAEGDEEENRGGHSKSLESHKQPLGVLIKVSPSGLSEPSPGPVVKTETLSPSSLGLQGTPVEALWPSRTTKCEADSSVLLCPDGRPLVFTDFTAGPKSVKRPSSRDHLVETLCPPSPLTINDS